MKSFLYCFVIWNLGVLLSARGYVSHGAATLEFPCVNSQCVVKDDSLRFYILGDWGGKTHDPYTTDIQYRVADGLAKLSTKRSVHFYVSTGDHFYNHGVKNVEDPRFEKTFELVYNKKGHHKPWYVVAGNHDHNGNVSAQIAYSQVNERWNYPSKFYSFSYKITEKLTAEFIMIDTVELCGQIIDDGAEQNSEYEAKSNEQQKWNWIEEKLNSSNASYLFVVGHYPVYSAGFHGTNRCMVKYLKPMLEANRVSAYLSGHDHNIQHLTARENTNWTVNYVVSGLASKYDSYVRSTKRLGPAKLKMFYPDKEYKSYNKDKETGGFVYCHLRSDSGKFSYRDGDGKELYSAKFQRR